MNAWPHGSHARNDVDAVHRPPPVDCAGENGNEVPFSLSAIGRPGPFATRVHLRLIKAAMQVECQFAAVHARCCAHPACQENTSQGTGAFINKNRIRTMSLSFRDQSEVAVTSYAPAARSPRPGRFPVPRYLNKYYWWAYVHPLAVRFWERQWLINLVLLGNYKKLDAAALEALGDHLPGKTLQVSACYGSLSTDMAQRIQKSGGTLDVIDILPVQLENLRSKLWPGAPVRMQEMDSEHLEYADNSFDRVVLFFLMHEQPDGVRDNSLREALRVLKPGGQILMVDYGQSSKWHPLRYLLLPFLRFLEPFAVKLWYNEMTEVMPQAMAGRTWKKTSYFGGMYQRLVSTK
jgi:ubiquinone/menaquinone biosynthesis C-methylase UbiE